MSTNKRAFFFSALIAVIVVAAETSVHAQTNKSENGNKSNKQKVVALLNSFNTGDQTPISYINPAKYVQHNLSVGDGLAGFGAVMKNAPAGGFKANVVRAFEDGDFVFTHTEYDFFGPKAGFDIFRFENGRIVEHWDNLAAITPPNPSGQTQFDGTEKIVDRDKTEANKKVVSDLITKVFLGGQMDKIATYINPTKYLQHSSAIADGLQGLGAAMQDPNAPKMQFQKLHKVLGEGNFVLSISEGLLGGKKTSYYDLFRLENGQIVEHWDVMEKILPSSEARNKNGKFNFHGIMEVTTFNIKADVDLVKFKARDAQVQSDFTSKQPGFIKRQSGVNEKGEVAVVVYWATMADADASMGKFMKDGAVADYAGMIDGPTMKMSRFSMGESFGAPNAQFVELMSFGTKPEIDMDKFDALNHRVETDFTGTRDGFVQRLTGVNEAGKQVVAVYWSTKTASDASLKPFMAAPISKAFMQEMDGSTVWMGRYELLK